MAAPSFVGTANSGTVITGASGTVINDSGGSLSTTHTLLVAILQDGTSTTSTLSSISSSISDLGGTTAAMTAFPAAFYNAGSPAAAKVVCFIGRVNTNISNGATLFTANSAGGDDLYLQVYFLNSVSTGSTFATVVENGTAGTVNSDALTQIAVNDVAVQTLDTDRLAINIVGVNDDNALADFTGETGGDWTLRASFGSATGTDGEIGIEAALMSSAGTINGGSFNMAASDGWGVVGFALIGTTAPTSAITTRNPWPALQAVNRASVY